MLESTTSERVNAITFLPDEYRKEICPPPRSVKIELTGRCNLRCKFCAHEQRKRNVADMDQELFSRLALEMRELGVQELGLFYLGESMLVPWLPDAVACARSLGYENIFLTTNGTACTPEMLYAVMAAGLTSLKFSCNYANVDQFVKIAQVKSTLFDKIEESIQAAWHIREAFKFPCYLAASFITYNAKQIKRMRPMVARISPFVDEFYRLPLYNQAAQVEEAGWDFVKGNAGTVTALRDPVPCWSIFTEGHVTFDGKLAACCFDHNHTFEMADLTQVTFMDGWNSEKFQVLRRAHLSGDVSGTICGPCING